jgi:hypothetical protein
MLDQQGGNHGRPLYRVGSHRCWCGLGLFHYLTNRDATHSQKERVNHPEGCESPTKFGASVVLTRNARPGQKIQLAVFGINGPLSNPPGNFIWVRSATLDFYKTLPIASTQFVYTEIVRVDPALDAIVSSDTKLEKLAGGFLFTEGPVWVPATVNTSGYLLFSDPNANSIYRWSPEGQVSIFRTKSGYAGFNVGE